MRYSKAHKQATRDRIIQTAGRRFKEDGLDGTGVATLMADAGLTNGAFYGHFTSKEDLIANVVADQLRFLRPVVDAQLGDHEWLQTFVRSYLSAGHRDNSGAGCPNAALLEEIARRSAGTRAIFTDRLMHMMDDIAARIEPSDPASARVDALVLFGAMGGILQLARAIADPDLSDQLLARGARNIMALLDSPRA